MLSKKNEGSLDSQHLSVWTIKFKNDYASSNITARQWQYGLAENSFSSFSLMIDARRVSVCLRIWYFPGVSILFAPKGTRSKRACAVNCETMWKIRFSVRCRVKTRVALCIHRLVWTTDRSEIVRVRRRKAQETPWPVPDSERSTRCT